jgi:hypothetical protein
MSFDSAIIRTKIRECRYFKTALVMCERCASECENIHKWSIAKNVEACRKCAEMCHEHEMANRVAKFNFMKATHQH